MSTQKADTALVTGATAGLGAAYAKELAARGRNLLLVDPSIDMLVNNADSALFGPLSAADPDGLEWLITFNLISTTRLAAAAAKAFSARGSGTIVNISSALALNILPVGAVYSGTKADVLAFTQALAQEFAGSGVRVQVVVPGALETAIWDGSGIELDQLPKEAVMAPRDAARAALAGSWAAGQATTSGRRTVESAPQGGGAGRCTYGARTLRGVKRFRTLGWRTRQPVAG
ncbi:SDR family NAD(P)-dependent oxidoreductase [Streptomyces sp. 900116325]